MLGFGSVYRVASRIWLAVVTPGASNCFLLAKGRQNLKPRHPVGLLSRGPLHAQSPLGSACDFLSAVVNSCHAKAVWCGNNSCGNMENKMSDENKDMMEFMRKVFVEM